MMYVDSKVCIGCGSCIQDCVVGDIQMVDGKAVMKQEACFDCGHCLAICPVDAVVSDHNQEDVREYVAEEFEIDPQRLLNFMEFRRSIRFFQNKPIEREKLRMLVEAGRYAPTGGNSQQVSYLVVEEKREELRRLALNSLKQKAEFILSHPTPENKRYERYAHLWNMMYQQYETDPSGPDRLFFHAPTILLVAAPSPVDAALASANIELMANALGLGNVYCGFFLLAADGNQMIQDWMQLPPGHQPVTCMVLGYPDVIYHRTVPRKSPTIIYQ